MKRYFFLITILILYGTPSFADDGFQVTSTETLVIPKHLVPAHITRYNPSQVYIIFTYSYSGRKGNTSQEYNEQVVKYLDSKQDTVSDIKGFFAFIQNWGSVKGYRLLYENNNTVDSLKDVDLKSRVLQVAYPAGDKLRILEYDTTGRLKDQFYLNYIEKLERQKIFASEAVKLHVIIRQGILYTSTDRNDYSLGKVWMLSIGIDDNGDRQYKNCKSDAIAYSEFFRDQYMKLVGPDKKSLFNSRLLLDGGATRQAILEGLREIASKATVADIFIFNFSGQSNLFTTDSINYQTYFYPFDVIGFNKPILRATKGTEGVYDSLISLKELQEYIRIIPCTQQLFISEAGPSAKFKTEFIRTMTQNSPTLAALLNINRVIIVPNKDGYDELNCQGIPTNKGPITYFITSLPRKYNIYDLFNSSRSSEIATALKAQAYNCDFFKGDYFDVFFERQFLQQYQEIFGEKLMKTRGGKTVSTEALNIESFSGKRYALVIGTDIYKGKGWDKLDNAVFDATEIAQKLKDYYDYDTTLLINAPMDSIYSALRRFYQVMRSNDQFILYIAGHGDFDGGLLDDGFIVCSDSRSVETDPLRNSYIQHTKLKKMLNKLPAKQVLVLLDICHGGSFDERVLGKKRENPASSVANINAIELMKEKSEFTTRKMLSSVGKKDPALDGTAGKHSPFSAHLLNILQAKGGTIGIITLAQIYALLVEYSLDNKDEKLKIKPHLANFGDYDGESEFILIPVSN